MFSTRKHELIDNELLLEAEERCRVGGGEQKIIRRKFECVASGFKDCQLNNETELDKLKLNYIDEDYDAAIYFYSVAQELYKNCTLKQRSILIALFVKRLRLCDIATEKELKSQTIISHLKIIHTKALKLELNLI